MNHNDIRHKLSEYLDNVLSADELAAVETHLKSCQACSDALVELRKTVEQVKQVEEVDPPSWMTQKIMAKVRAEAEEKRSWYQRFFFPLTVKLPIQAVAVMFLAVTAYYVYQNINPVEKYAEAPQAASPAKEQTIAEEAPDRSKQVEQSPGYKALDMRLEYERPAPPKPLDDAGVPAPGGSATPSREAKKDATGEMRQAPQAAAPSAMRDKAERSMGMVAEQEMTTAEQFQPRKAGAMAAGTGAIHVSLTVADIPEADKKVEGFVRELRGAVLRRESSTETRSMIISLDAKMLGALRDQLGTLGALKEKGTPSADYKGTLHIEIVLTPAPRP